MTRYMMCPCRIGCLPYTLPQSGSKTRKFQAKALSACNDEAAGLGATRSPAGLSQERLGSGSTSLSGRIVSPAPGPGRIG